MSPQVIEVIVRMAAGESLLRETFKGYRVYLVSPDKTESPVRMNVLCEIGLLVEVASQEGPNGMCVETFALTNAGREIAEAHSVGVQPVLMHP